jgi:hypothetical protein
MISIRLTVPTSLNITFTSNFSDVRTTDVRFIMVVIVSIEKGGTKKVLDL